VPRIHQLPPSVITKIAAGEVIERPASVVKELLENSVDAGSKRIDIDLEQGGVELIRLVDDGCGIEAEDLLLAFSSHATSKLQDAEDLFRIGTLGFRGEALASIGGVARVTLQSRAVGQSIGAEIHCNGGELSAIQPWNGSFGTRIEVRHLFFNTPVRKKFLKTSATELGHICESVTRIALANPNLHITLKHNNKLVHEIPSSASLKDRIGLFFGREVRDQLYEVQLEDGPITLSGFIADPACERGNAKLQYLFLNGRWIRDRSLFHALQEAYRGLLMTGRYAVAFLFLNLPPDQVDVNVHPTKSEVRFRDSQTMYHLVRRAVRNRLSKQNLIPKLQVPEDAPFQEKIVHQPIVEPISTPNVDPTTLFAESPRKVLAEYTPAPWETNRPNVTPVVESKSSIPPKPIDESITPSQEIPPKPFEKETPKTQSPIQSFPIPQGVLRAIQIHDSYLVVETPEGMLVIDQHALHERILYEQLRRRIRNGQLEVQRLLIPEPIDLPNEQSAIVLEAKEDLQQLGLEIEDFGGGTILLSSYPVLLGRAAPSNILKGVIDYLITKERPPTKEQLVNHLLATMACKAAVKAGDRLTPEEISYLMELRQLAEDSHHCPHGRPTSLIFSRQELDKQFRRI
jgi:DNA mismatch repair protein MutL